MNNSGMGTLIIKAVPFERVVQLLCKNYTREHVNIKVVNFSKI